MTEGKREGYFIPSLLYKLSFKQESPHILVVQNCSGQKEKSFMVIGPIQQTDLTKFNIVVIVYCDCF